MEQLVYINVIGFPGGLLQPVRATLEHAFCYRLLESSQDPDHDNWEFQEGDVVQCRHQEFSEGELGLIAVALCKCLST